MHEQAAKTQISLNIDTVWSESLLSAWTNAYDDLSLFGLQDIVLNFQEFAQIYGNDNSNAKNYDMDINNANALCEYMIVLNVLIVSIFL